VLGNATVQTGQEVGQSLLLPAAEEIAAALDKDIKGPDYRGFLRVYTLRQAAERGQMGATSPRRAWLRNERR
jgi:hypothetical protein